MTPMKHSCTLLAAILVGAQVSAGEVAAQPGTAPSSRYDVLIAGGSIVDGTGSPARRADIAIRDDRIVLVSAQPIARSRAARVIDATGRVVAPGFIDMYAHLDPRHVFGHR